MKIRVVRRHVTAVRKRVLRAPGKSGKPKTYRGAFDCHTDPIGLAGGEKLDADGVVVRPDLGFIFVEKNGRNSKYACPDGVENFWKRVEFRGPAPTFSFELKRVSCLS